MDPQEVADDAGLRHVDPKRLPIVRRPHGSGFRYLRGSRPVDDAARDRIVALAIPPAWTDVRIAADDPSHILASGVDEAGRTQYRYHERFRQEADRLKFARLGPVGERLARLRTSAADVLRSDHDHRDLAAIVGLIDVTAIRVGSERYATEHGTIGASTLQRRHVDVDDPRVRLAYTGKGGIDRDLSFERRDLARFLDERRAMLRRAADPLFAGPDGGRVTGGAIGRCLTDWSGVPMTAKELRTWSATATMVASLMAPGDVTDDVSQSDDPVLAAYDAVAHHLGNTRAVARSSYVAPVVVEAYDDGRLERAWSRSRRSATYARAEQALRKILTADADSVR
ncbi:DNA topoisomerase IB [Ilumatobacter sp.]|uniref:DNA topoisomerase IB n=1 Tax=Ilumatobacter sp. TaxID=1967498 RepID=UPI003B52BF97